MKGQGRIQGRGVKGDSSPPEIFKKGKQKGGNREKEQNKEVEPLTL